MCNALMIYQNSNDDRVYERVLKCVVLMLVPKYSHLVRQMRLLRMVVLLQSCCFTLGSPKARTYRDCF
jgi:hypothetical protein